MERTFEQSLNSSEVLGADLFFRDAFFLELSREYGQRVCYDTFYYWAQKLCIPSGKASYTADETLSFLTLIWARARNLRGLTRNDVLHLRSDYATVRRDREIAKRGH